MSDQISIEWRTQRPSHGFQVPDVIANDNTVNLLSPVTRKQKESDTTIITTQKSILFVPKVKMSYCTLHLIKCIAAFPEHERNAVQGKL